MNRFLLPHSNRSFVWLDDEEEVLALAQADGCAQVLLEALYGKEDGTVTVIVGWTIYLVHATGDRGLSAILLDEPSDLPVVLAMLAQVIGPAASVSFTETAPVVTH